MTVKEEYPEYLVQASWEVCNKVGGIYTVLSSQAGLLFDKMGDRLFFVGPDLDSPASQTDFREDDTLLGDFLDFASREYGLQARAGRWNIPGQPQVLLVRFHEEASERNRTYARMWERYGVDSLHAYGDYDEACDFAMAAGRLTEALYRFLSPFSGAFVFQAHEWTMGMSLLYLKTAVPQIGTVFTTHATSIGRSIASNGKPLYAYFRYYFGDQMASELNMESKHSLEKAAANQADCFTTVSSVTDRECVQLLEKPADVVVPNGFNDSFVPSGSRFTSLRTKSRKALIRIASALKGRTFDDNTLLVGTSGRSEFRNKGIDMFLEALSRVRNMEGSREILAFIFVPSWQKGPRADLGARLQSSEHSSVPLPLPFITHELHEPWNDSISRRIAELRLDGSVDRSVSVVFLPAYLDGGDGILDIPYYDMLPGLDLTVYPSYYEPWGYTPLESIAFHCPTVTTSLAGFGSWALQQTRDAGLSSGVKVILRDDRNFQEASEETAKVMEELRDASAAAIRTIRRRAHELSKRALWNGFLPEIQSAYHLAMEKAQGRMADVSSAR